MSQSSNPLHFLNKLPAATVVQLARAAENLGRTQVRRRRVLSLVKGRDYLGCRICHERWEAGTQPAHAPWCIVSRTARLADQVLSLFHNRIPDERSEANATTADGSRAAGEPSGLPETIALTPSPGYGEPWAFDPGSVTIRDRSDFVVVNLLHTELEPDEQATMGKRIAACVNFLHGTPNEWLRHASDSVRASMPERPGCEWDEGRTLDCDARGWFVDADGARLRFPDYAAAKSYYDTRGVVRR
jgi:hypothetical protein